MDLFVSEETVPSTKKMASQFPSVEEIKTLNTPSLVQRLKEAVPYIDECALVFLEKERVTGRHFLGLTRYDLDSRGLELGPTKDVLQIIDEIKSGQPEVLSNVKYTSGTDSEVENMTTRMDSLVVGDNADSPSRKAGRQPSGKLLRKLCEKNKIQVDDTLRYKEGEELFDGKIVEIDENWEPLFSFTYKEQEYEQKFSELEPLAKWMLKSRDPERVISRLRNVYNKTKLIRADERCNIFYCFWYICDRRVTGWAYNAIWYLGTARPWLRWAEHTTSLDTPAATPAEIIFQYY
ncbi:unnamed protein product [Rhizophagus irregularis]|nr:unnamed protein product [Rhizophagus irregularis]